MEIVRWTTPSITYKPEAVELSDIAQVRLVIAQSPCVEIVKTEADAVVLDGKLMWRLTQEETGSLVPKAAATVKIDYVTTGGLRYAVKGRIVNVTDSAVNGVIA